MMLLNKIQILKEHLYYMKVKVTQLCPSLCDPMDYTGHGILQARILEWVAFPFSRGSSQWAVSIPAEPQGKPFYYSRWCHILPITNEFLFLRILANVWYGESLKF